MRILIVTPVFNSGVLIERTLESVRSQASESVHVRHFVCDGGSTDGTVEILAKYKEGNSTDNYDFSYISEPDRGMYDAIARGFESHDASSFDVFGYINAGDYYAPRAFSNAARVFVGGEDWITGINVKYNEAGDVIGARLPGPYLSRLVRVGVYGLFLPCIQQESTLWTRPVHGCIDFEKLRGLKLAGDYFLWKCMASRHNLTAVSLWIGGFTIHEGQLSAVHRKAYFRELRQVASARTPVDYLLAVCVGIIWLLPDSLRLRMMKGRVKPFVSAPLENGVSR